MCLCLLLLSCSAFALVLFCFCSRPALLLLSYCSTFALVLLCFCSYPAPIAATSKPCDTDFPSHRRQKMPHSMENHAHPIVPYSMHVSARYLGLTRQKLELTRLPRESGIPVRASERWELGTPKSVLEPLLDYWYVDVWRWCWCLHIKGAIAHVDAGRKRTTGARRKKSSTRHSRSLGP